MSVRIGQARSLNDPESETVLPDDRQELIQVMGGVVVQDYGVVAAGEKIAWTLNFLPSEWEKVVTYWKNRTMVAVTGAGGKPFMARVLVKSYRRIDRFRGAVTAQLELWLV